MLTGLQRSEASPEKQDNHRVITGQAGSRRAQPRPEAEKEHHGPAWRQLARCLPRHLSPPSEQALEAPSHPCTGPERMSASGWGLTKEPHGNLCGKAGRGLWVGSFNTALLLGLGCPETPRNKTSLSQRRNTCQPLLLPRTERSQELEPQGPARPGWARPASPGCSLETGRMNPSGL